MGCGMRGEGYDDDATDRRRYLNYRPAICEMAVSGEGGL